LPTPNTFLVFFARLIFSSLEELEFEELELESDELLDPEDEELLEPEELLPDEDYLPFFFFVTGARFFCGGFLGARFFFFIFG